MNGLPSTGVRGVVSGGGVEVGEGQSRGEGRVEDVMLLYLSYPT